MKLIFLILVLSLPAMAQIKESSICFALIDSFRDPILSICNTGTGMTALPRTRLYLRVYADGEAFYEENDGDKLVLRKFKASAEHIAEIKKLIRAKDMQKVEREYPAYRIWTDSGLQTRVVFQDAKIAKEVSLHNFSVSDVDNYKRYPVSLVTMLSLADEIRSGKTAVPKFIAYGDAAAETRTIEVGKTYRGKVNFGDAYGMRLTPFPVLPNHHKVMYRWTNVKDFPQLDPDKDFGVRTIVFTVLEADIDNTEKYNYITTYTIEILRVD